MHTRTSPTASRRAVLTLQVLFGVLWAGPAFGQVDQERAAQYFTEAAALCTREGGRLWGVSLCGPIVIADPATRTIATSEPPPDAPRPPTLGYANAAVNWGETRWTTLVWPLIPSDERARGILMMHELFHRVQPGLGLLLPEPDNSHLDTLEGRYWLQLEWRALAAALRASGDARLAALQDALAFRAERHKAFPDAAANERVLEINEGLAHYTGTVAATSSAAEAPDAALARLDGAGPDDTFVRTFAYVSGPPYGLLLDAFSPGWTRRFTAESDLARLVMTAASLTPASDAGAASRRYGGPELRAAEDARAAAHAARVAELRRRFVDGPVIVLPRPRRASFVTTGMVPIPGAGLIYPNYRTTAEWGTLEAERVLMSADGATIALPAPASTEGPTITGDGWTLTLAPGWTIRPGPRQGDFVVAAGVAGAQQPDAAAAAVIARLQESTASPAVSSAVIADRGVAWTHDADRPHRIGSVSKLFTATALARLAARGAIDLDSPVQRYVPEFPHADVTLRHLAGHLGGVRHYGRAEYINTKAYGSVAESLPLFVTDPLVAPAGTKYAYSSYGYNLLGAAMERAAKMPFVEIDPALSGPGPGRGAARESGVRADYREGRARTGRAVSAATGDVDNRHLPAPYGLRGRRIDDFFVTEHLPAGERHHHGSENSHHMEFLIRPARAEDAPRVSGLAFAAKASWGGALPAPMAGAPERILPVLEFTISRRP